MKKVKLKSGIKKILMILVIYFIGFGCIIAMVERANQINRSMEYEEINR